MTLTVSLLSIRRKIESVILSHILFSYSVPVICCKKVLSSSSLSQISGIFTLDNYYLAYFLLFFFIFIQHTVFTCFLSVFVQTRVNKITVITPDVFKRNQESFAYEEGETPDCNDKPLSITTF